MRGAAGLTGFGAALLFSSAADAGVDEMHVGVMQHNICIADCKNANKEDGPSVELQLSFDSPDWLDWVGSPQPYVVASANVAGDTSFGGLGVEWRWNFADKWALEPGVGYVVHDGETNNPFANGTAEAEAFAEDHVLLGSRDLFRLSLGVTRAIDGPWEVQFLFSHLSHGHILGDDRNQGIDQFGIRVGRRLG